MLHLFLACSAGVEDHDDDDGSSLPTVETVEEFASATGRSECEFYAACYPDPFADSYTGVDECIEHAEGEYLDWMLGMREAGCTFDADRADECLAARAEVAETCSEQDGVEANDVCETVWDCS